MVETSIVEYIVNAADLKPLCRLAANIYHNKDINTRYDLFDPDLDAADCTNLENVD